MKPTLADLQATMLRGITAGDDAPLKLMRPPPNDTPEVMFGVYRNAYVLRLEEFLRNDQPRLLGYLGDDQFRDMARGYVKAHPSDNPNARWFSRHLPLYLRSAEPWSEHVEIAELAELEQALNTVFDAAEAPVFGMADLQGLDHARFDQAVITFQPAHELLQLQTSAGAIWTALKNEEPPPEVERFAEPRTVLAWRMNAASRWRALNPEEAMAFAEASKGLPFGVLCEMIAFMGDPDTAAVRAATYLRQWIDAELVTSIGTPESAN